MVSRQFLGFLFVGVTAGLVNLASRAAFNQVMIYEISVVLAFAVATTTAFVMNRGLVFRPSSGSVRSMYAKFAAVNVLALVQVWLVSVLLLRAVFPYLGFEWHAPLIAHTIGVGSPLITSFLAYKYFVFPRNAQLE